MLAALSVLLLGDLRVFDDAVHLRDCQLGSLVRALPDTALGNETIVGITVLSGTQDNILPLKLVEEDTLVPNSESALINGILDPSIENFVQLAAGVNAAGTSEKSGGFHDE